MTRQRFLDHCLALIAWAGILFLPILAAAILQP